MTMANEKNLEREGRIARLKGIVEEIRNRLSAIETQLGDIRASLRWMVGIQISMLLVLIGLLLKLMG